jgi:hypothetical protein
VILAFVAACFAASRPPPLPSPSAPVPSAAQVYQTWLTSQGVTRTDFHEEERWRVPGWGFFTLDGPFLDHPAAVGPGGVASRETPAGWYDLLALPVAEAAPRVAWLLGNPIPLAAGSPVSPGAHVADPTLTTSGDTRVLTMWVAWPPQASEPFRVVLTARADHTATIDEAHWAEVK